jgi:hypothetical protein
LCVLQLRDQGLELLRHTFSKWCSNFSRTGSLSLSLSLSLSVCVCVVWCVVCVLSVCVCTLYICVYSICTHYMHTHTHSHTHTKQACILAQGLMNAQVFAHLGSAAGMPVLSRSLLLLIRSRLFVHWVSFDPGHTFAHPRTKAMLLTIAGRTCPYFPRQENTFLIFVLIFPSKKMKFLDEICGRVLTFPGTRTHSCFLLMFPYKEIKKLAGVSLLSQARQLSV